MPPCRVNHHHHLVHGSLQMLALRGEALETLLCLPRVVSARGVCWGHDVMVVGRVIGVWWCVWWWIVYLTSTSAVVMDNKSLMRHEAPNYTQHIHCSLPTKCVVYESCPKLITH